MPKLKDYGPATRASSRQGSRQTGPSSVKLKEEDAAVPSTSNNPDDALPSVEGVAESEEESSFASAEGSREASEEVEQQPATAQGSPEQHPSPDYLADLSDAEGTPQAQLQAEILAATAASHPEEVSLSPPPESLIEIPSMAATQADRLQALEDLVARMQGNNRGVTPINSAFGGKAFKPTGQAALKAFEPYGSDQNEDNPQFDKTARKSGLKPDEFRGDKETFDDWIIAVADMMTDDNPTYRTERSRMAALFNLVKDNARGLIRSRYQSVERPFSGVAEMIATLAAVYHDDNQVIKAQETLKTMMFDPANKEVDIHMFIGQLNKVADQAEISHDNRARKDTLLQHIPAWLDNRLLSDVKNPDVSYETFTNLVANAAVQQQRGYAERKKRDANRPKTSGSSGQPIKRNWPKALESNKDKIKVPGLKKLSPAEEEAHREKRLCFLCHKSGHMARECSDKPAVAALFEQLEEIMAQQSDAEVSGASDNEGSGSKN